MAFVIFAILFGLTLKELHSAGRSLWATPARWIYLGELWWAYLFWKAFLMKVDVGTLI